MPGIMLGLLRFFIRSGDKNNLLAIFLVPSLVYQNWREVCQQWIFTPNVDSWSELIDHNNLQLKPVKGIYARWPDSQYPHGRCQSDVNILIEPKKLSSSGQRGKHNHGQLHVATYNLHSPVKQYNKFRNRFTI